MTVSAYVLLTCVGTFLLITFGTRTDADDQILLALSQATPAFAALLLCVVLPKRRSNFGQLGLFRLGGWRWRWYVLAFLLPAIPIALSYLSRSIIGSINIVLIG